MPEKVFVCRRIPPIGIDLLRQSGFEVEVHPGPLPPSRAELMAGVRGCHGILSLLSDRVDAQVMDAAGGGLQVISNFAVGYNNIDVTEASRRGIRVGNTPDVLTQATADVAVGLVLAAARQFRAGLDATRNGDWKTWEPLGWIGQDLVDRTLGIVGMGRIGQAVARRLHAGWNMRVLYSSQSPKPLVDQELSAQHVPLERLLSESDVISLHLPLSDHTRHCISTQQFAAMKPSAILVNTARGEVIDQDALVAALRNQQIFAAGLDVCTPEPLPVDHPLHKLPNCILLPHLGSATIQARDAMSLRSAQNIVACLRGDNLPYPVN